MIYFGERDISRSDMCHFQADAHCFSYHGSSGQGDVSVSPRPWVTVGSRVIRFVVGEINQFYVLSYRNLGLICPPSITEYILTGTTPVVPFKPIILLPVWQKIEGLRGTHCLANVQGVHAVGSRKVMTCEDLKATLERKAQTDCSFSQFCLGSGPWA